MKQVKLTKSQVKRVIDGLPGEIRKLLHEYVNTPTAEKEICEDLLNKVDILRKLKKDINIYLNSIESGELKQDVRELKKMCNLFGFK